MLPLMRATKPPQWSLKPQENKASTKELQGAPLIATNEEGGANHDSTRPSQRRTAQDGTSLILQTTAFTVTCSRLKCHTTHSPA